MSKIGDLFVRLGIKKDEFSRGIDDAKRETQGFGDSLKKMATAAKAAWLAVGAAVVKFASDTIQMTQKWGDRWRVEMAGMKAAYGTLVRQLSSGEGFDNLFANIRESVRLAKEAAASLDELFERRISYSYEEAETRKEIARLQLIMRDSSKSDKEREDAAKKIIKETKNLADLKRDIAQQDADDQKKQLRGQTKLNDDQINFLVKEYNKNREIIKAGRDYLEERARLEGQLAAAQGRAANARSGKDIVAANEKVAATKKALSDLEASTSQTVKDVGELTKKYDKGNDELISNLARAEVAVINVDEEMYHAQTRATALLGTLGKVSGGGASKGNPELDAAARIAQRAEDAAKDEVQLLSEKYDQEKALLEKYHIDTEELWREYVNNLTDIVIQEMDLGLDELANIEPVEIDPVVLEVDPEIEDFYKTFKEQFDKAEELSRQFNAAVVSGISDGCQEITDQLLGVRDINVGAIFQSLLGPLADLAIKQGEILVAQGIGVEACKKALRSLNGYAAIAAGFALLTVGAAAKSGLAALAKGGTSTTTTSGYEGSAGSASTQNIETEMTIHVEGRISGSDIVLAGQKTVNAWNR